jgi:hypothetical protein
MQKQVITCDICGEEIELRGGSETIDHPYQINIPLLRYQSPDIFVDGIQTKDICFDCILPFVELFEKMKKDNASSL